MLLNKNTFKLNVSLAVAYNFLLLQNLCLFVFNNQWQNMGTECPFTGMFYVQKNNKLWDLGVKEFTFIPFISNVLFRFDWQQRGQRRLKVYALLLLWV